MTCTDLLREQHDAAMAMAQRLLDLIDEFQPGMPGYPILMQLNRLYGILRVHLAQEDVAVYPRLLKSADPAVTEKAKAFVAEIGELAIDLECFARHWSSSASIVSNFAEFREATHELLLRLAVRIDLETRELYPLVEQRHAARNAA